MSDLVERANEYLINGGLFNPELMDHDKVRDLIIDCCQQIEHLEAALAEATRLMTEASRDAGHWKGKYEAAGYPGTLDGWVEKAKALEAENARLQSCVWRADYLAIAAQKLVDVERTHAGCSGIQLTKLSEELALYWKHAGGTPSARAALAGKAGE